MGRIRDLSDDVERGEYHKANFLRKTDGDENTHPVVRCIPSLIRQWLCTTVSNSRIFSELLKLALVVFTVLSG